MSKIVTKGELMDLVNKMVDDKIKIKEIEHEMAVTELKRISVERQLILAIRAASEEEIKEALDDNEKRKVIFYG